MTNKHIIDGVDVSECEDYGYRGKAGYWCHNYDEPCTDYPNCCYKQLKRKEQECEELKQTLDRIKDIVEKKCLGCANFYNDCNIRFCVIKQILQVIRESEGNDES